MKVPANYKLAFAAKEIEKRIELIARDISSWSQSVSNSTEHDVLAVPVLRGSIFFFADLMRKVNAIVEVAPVRSRAYVTDVNGYSLPDVTVELFDLQPKGRSILLIDDICDSGRTLAKLAESLLAKGATEVKTAVLIRRIIEDSKHNPDYVAFDYSGTEWFVGYGMEDKNRWSTLPDVYTLTATEV